MLRAQARNLDLAQRMLASASASPLLLLRRYLHLRLTATHGIRSLSHSLTHIINFITTSLVLVFLLLYVGVGRRCR